MSRTKDHANRRRSVDLWSRRPCTNMIKCKYTRKLTSRIERAEAKLAAVNGIEDAFYEFWEREWDEKEDCPYDYDYLLDGLPTKWNSSMDFTTIEKEANNAWEIYWDVVFGDII